MFTGLIQKTGFIKSIDSFVIGSNSMLLGAGRVEKNSKIDYDAGIILNKKKGDFVRKGDVLCLLYGKTINYEEIYSAFKISFLKPISKNIIIKVIE